DPSRQDVPSRAGFRDAPARGLGSGRTKCAHFAFDELLDAGRTRARSDGPFLFESDPPRRRFSSRTATAGFSAGRWGGDGVADAQINALRLFCSRRPVGGATFGYRRRSRASHSEATTEEPCGRTRTLKHATRRRDSIVS